MAEPQIQPAQTQFNQAANLALAEARSPMEVANERAMATQTGIQPINPVLPTNFDDALKAARQADTAQSNAQVQGKQPTPPAAKPEAAAISTPDDDNISLDWKPKDKRKAANWDEMKSSYEQRLSALQKELETHKTKAPSIDDITKHPEWAKIKAERDEFYNIVKDVAVERDPEFKSKYEPKIDAVIKAAKFAAGGNAEKVEKLLKQPSSPERDLAIEEILKDSNPTTKRKIEAALLHLDQISIERDAEIASRKANFEARQLDQFKQHELAQRERNAKIEKAFEQTAKQWSDPEEGMPFLVKRDGDEKWNRKVEQSLEIARNVFSGKMSEDDLAKASLWAAVGPRAVEGWQEAVSKLEAANAYIQRLTGLQPGDGSIPRSDNAQPRKVTTNPIEYHEDFSQGLEAARQRDMAGQRW